VDVALVGDLAEVLADLLPLVSPETHADWLARIHQLKGDAAVRDIQNLPTTATSTPLTSSTTCGARPTAARSS